MNYAVIGVGYTGKRVCQLLPRDQLTALNRSPVDDAAILAAMQLFDLDKPGGKIIHLPSPSTILYTVPPDANNQRLQNFTDALDADLQRCVYLSTSGVYGDRGGAVVTENDAPRPETKRAERRLEAEAMLQDWCLENRAELVVLRVPGIYGPGRLGLSRLAAGTPLIREKDAHPGNRIHVDDLAACAVAAMTLMVPAGIYNVGDGDHRSGTWFSQTVARLAGLAALPEITREMALQTFSRKRLSFLRESRRLDTQKMRETLGFTPRYHDPVEGIRASL